MRWLWAAYQMDVWEEIFPKNMNRDMFTEKLMELLGSVDMDWIIEVKTERGLRPVGIILGQFRAADRAVEPHVDFFPWATLRNKLETMAQYITDVGKQYKIFVYTDKEDRFWKRIWKYRMLRKGCSINDYFSAGEPADFYYTPGPF